jgi:FlaA1/EpsC-like NDP-sugar epimerase
VRYGNVLASTGSVLTVWNRQRLASQRLTVTDGTMTRFWMTIDAAVKHIFTALRIMRGGEVIIPVLRSSTLALMAEAFTDALGYYLHGLNPNIRHIGKRPGGEKKHESLINSDESLRAIAQDGVLVIPPAVHSWTTTSWKTDDSVEIPDPYQSNAPTVCTYTKEELIDVCRKLYADDVQHVREGTRG